MIEEARGPRAALAGEEESFRDADLFRRLVSSSPLFERGRPVVLTRAPGRLDVLGGIADYSGSLVLTMPLAAAVLVAAQLRDDGRVIVVSGERRLALDVKTLVASSFEALRECFAGSAAWAAYALGPIALLAREEEEEASFGGLRLLISSAIPEGKGMGSSSALEVAVLQAVTACLGLPLELRQLALLAQRAEQLLAGAPCGAMDQMTAAYGLPGRLLVLLCRPAEIVDVVPLPPPLALWGLDSGVPHAVAGPAYRRARCAAFMGKALLSCEREYLAGLELSALDSRQLPARLRGSEFVRLGKRIEDPFSIVEEDADYPVRAATLFPLEEQARAREFARLLSQPVSDDSARALGELMRESHLGYSRCGLGTSRTDELVQAIEDAGWEQGFVGARASGGGSGGTVVVLGREDAESRLREIAAELGAGIVGGSSAGAAHFGTRRLVR
jgi:galactokinase